MTFERGDVVYGADPFKGSDYSRPWLVISNATHPFQGDQYVVLALTTKTWHDELVAIAESQWIEGGTSEDSSIVPWSIETLEAELVLSLEVLFHLVKDEIFEKTMRDIFGAATRYVILFSSNHDDTTPELHVRHRKFTDYVAREFPAFDLVERVENEYEERVSDFYIYEKTGE